VNAISFMLLMKVVLIMDFLIWQIMVV
jgi:hypothetical protein